MQTTRLGAAARRFGLAIGLGVILAPAPAYALDPVTFFLIPFVRNLIDSAIESHQAKAKAPAPMPAPAPVSAPLPALKSPANMTDSDLRVLVDESFAHLTRAQREELYQSLDKALSDPANAANRELILAQFMNVANQMRFTHAQLNRLSTEEKRMLAEQFAANFRNLTPEQQQSLQEQLTQRALPLPADLNEMMQAAVSPQR